MGTPRIVDLRTQPEAHPIVGIPLSLAMLCADCSMLFQIGPSACPACASATMMPVARLLEGKGAASQALVDASRQLVTTLTRLACAHVTQEEVEAVKEVLPHV